MLRRSLLQGMALMPFGTQQSQGFNNPLLLNFAAGNTRITPNGIFVYSGLPAAGNLIFSSVGLGVTQDKFGNKVIQASTSEYQNLGGIPQFAISSGGGSVQLYIFTAGNWVLETWHNMTLLNSWAANVSFVTPRYKFNAILQVEVEGAINANAATASTFAQLPALYRPANSVPVCAAGSNVNDGGLTPNVRCDTLGNLTMANTAVLPVAGTYLFKGTIDPSV